MYTWLYACFPFSWLGQPSGKTLLTALHKYFYQNYKTFPSHPEHAKSWFVFLSCCRCPGWQCSPSSGGWAEHIWWVSSGEGRSTHCPEPQWPYNSPSIWDCSRWGALDPPCQTQQTSAAEHSRVQEKTDAFTALGCSRKSQMASQSALSENSRWIFVVANFRLLPWGISLQGFLLWGRKWQGNLLLLPWKPP